MIKTNAPQTTPICRLLDGIVAGTFYTSCYDAFRWNGFEYKMVGRSVARCLGINVYLHYSIQTVRIPEDQRGNLFTFAGKTVEVICTAIGRRQALIGIWVKESAIR